MCIRDRGRAEQRTNWRDAGSSRPEPTRGRLLPEHPPGYSCLLYTSDAADERSSVDLGGRRIIKKKKRDNRRGARWTHNISKIELVELVSVREQRKIGGQVH